MVLELVTWTRGFTIGIELFSPGVEICSLFDIS